MENVEFNYGGRPPRKSGKGWIVVLIGFLVAIGALTVVSLNLVRVQKLLDEKRAEETESTAEPTTDPILPQIPPVVTPEVEAKLEYIRGLIGSSYLFDQKDVDYDTAIIKGYVNALGDPYTVYYSEKEFEEMREESSGEYYGVGISIQQDLNTMEITVIRVFRDSPAEKAGVKAGDKFYKIDGENVLGEDINVLVSKVRGKEGSTVELEMYRPSINDYVKLTCGRAKVQNETVIWEMKENGIGYIGVSEFEEVTADQFKKAYEELSASGMKGLLVDLRSNPGGLLDTVLSMLDYLLPEGLLTYTIDRNGVREEFKSEASAALNVPMVLLVNEYSASASEVFTGAMRDYDAATVVGTKTFGKGIVQVVMPLFDGTGIKLTVSRYYSPNGTCIHGEGFEPDVEIPYDAEYDGDNQLEKALDILKEKIH